MIFLRLNDWVTLQWLTDLQGKIFHLSFSFVFQLYHKCSQMFLLTAFYFLFQGPIEFVNCPQLLSLWTHVQDLQILLNSFTYLVSTSICAWYFQFFPAHSNLPASLVWDWWSSPPFLGFPTLCRVLGTTRPCPAFTVSAPCYIASSSDLLPSP